MVWSSLESAASSEHELPQTKLIATHDLDMALETCERTVVIERGQVVGDGPTEKLLSDQVFLETHGLELPLSHGRRL